jgi:hypothetical protein
LNRAGGLGFKTPDAATGAGLITLCSIWVLVYSLSLAPIGWTSLVEVSSPRLRAKTAAIATVIQSLSNILFVSLVPRPPTSCILSETQAYTVPYMLSPQYAGECSKLKPPQGKIKTPFSERSASDLKFDTMPRLRLDFADSCRLGIQDWVLLRGSRLALLGSMLFLIPRGVSSVDGTLDLSVLVLTYID